MALLCQHHTTKDELQYLTIRRHWKNITKLVSKHRRAATWEDHVLGLMLSPGCPPSLASLTLLQNDDEYSHTVHSCSWDFQPLSCHLFQTKTCQASYWISPRVHPSRWSLTRETSVGPHIMASTSARHQQLFSHLLTANTTAHPLHMPSLHQVVVAHRAPKMLDPHHLEEPACFFLNKGEASFVLCFELGHSAVVKFWKKLIVVGH